MTEYLSAGSDVTLKCSVSGCPRTKKYKVPRQEYGFYPAGTTVIKSKCPWHEDGDFDNDQFYDKDGNELY